MEINALPGYVSVYSSCWKGWSQVEFGDECSSFFSSGKITR